MLGQASRRSNICNASARAKARKASLIDSTRMRQLLQTCLLYTSPSPRDQRGSRMPSSA